MSCRRPSSPKTDVDALEARLGQMPGIGSAPEPTGVTVEMSVQTKHDGVQTMLLHDVTSIEARNQRGVTKPKRTPRAKRGAARAEELHLADLEAPELAHAESVIVGRAELADGIEGLSEEDLVALLPELPETARPDLMPASIELLKRITEPKNARRAVYVREKMLERQPDVLDPTPELEGARRADLVRTVLQVVKPDHVAQDDCAVVAIAACETPFLALTMKHAEDETSTVVWMRQIGQRDPESVKLVRDTAADMRKQREAAHNMERLATGEQTTSTDWCTEADRVLLKGDMQVFGPDKKERDGGALTLLDSFDLPSNMPPVEVPIRADPANVASGGLAPSAVFRVNDPRLDRPLDIGTMMNMPGFAQPVEIVSDGLPRRNGRMQQVNANDQNFISIPVRDRLAKMFLMYSHMLRSSSATEAVNHELRVLLAKQTPEGVPMDLYVAKLIREDMLPVTGNPQENTFQRSQPVAHAFSDLMRRLFRSDPSLVGVGPVVVKGAIDDFNGLPSPIGQNNRSQGEKLTYAQQYLQAIMKASGVTDATPGYSWFGTTVVSHQLMVHLVQGMANDGAGAFGNVAHNAQMANQFGGLDANNAQDQAQAVQGAAQAARADPSGLTTAYDVMKKLGAFVVTLKLIWEAVFGTGTLSMLASISSTVRRAVLRARWNQLMDFVRVPFVIAYDKWRWLGSRFVGTVAGVLGGGQNALAFAILLFFGANFTLLYYGGRVLIARRRRQ